MNNFEYKPERAWNLKTHKPINSMGTDGIAQEPLNIEFGPVIEVYSWAVVGYTLVPVYGLVGK